MRTTLTLDDDVAAQLTQLKRGGDRTFKQIVNDTLRAGLNDVPQQTAPKHPPKRYTIPRALGTKVDITDVSAALAMLDEEHDRHLYGRRDA